MQIARILLPPLCVFLLFTLAGCSDNSTQEDTHQTADSVTPPITPSDPVRLDQVEQLATQLHQHAIAAAEAMLANLNRAIRTGSPEALDVTRDGWFETHRQIQTLLALYQIGAPFQSMYEPQSHHYAAITLLDHTPLLPGYLDAVPGYPKSGIVHALDVEIELDNLLEKHQFADAEFVIFGLHPLEFFLWQKNALLLSQDSTVETKRRQLLVRLIATHLVEQLKAMHETWQNQEFSASYLPATSRQNEEEDPLLAAIMLVIQHLIVDQLEQDNDTDQNTYLNHSNYHQSPGLHWQGVLTGLEGLLNLPLPASPVNSISLTALATCLSDVSKPLAPDSCSTELTELRKQVIMRFSE